MKQLYFDFIDSLRSIDKVVLVFVLMQFTKAVGFLPFFPDFIGHVVMLSMSMYVIFKMDGFSVKMLTILLYMIFNILNCSPNGIFNPWLRFALFVVLLIAVSPLVQSKYLRVLRRDMLNAVLWIASVLSVLSFFCRFLGINFMLGITNSDYNTAGTFAGLFVQSMMLGPVAGISTVFLAYQAYVSEIKTTKKWYLAASLACFAAVAFSASRSALLATITGVTFMLMKAINDGQKFFKILASIWIIASLTFPIWGSALDGIIEKNNNNIIAGKSFYSREKKWNARITEFKSNPMFGIGFSSVNPQLDEVGVGGTVEPGSSWLAILSMSGIIGCGLFLMIFWNGYNACNQLYDPDDALLLGLLILFAVHMIAEGYVFAAGSFLCFLLWLIVGCCIDRKYEY
ncbi:O-antigen ligase family protein [Bacteroides sp.]|uniref:O-antigen ligase family protein n=1 Tax=Bacteroides sp. TaxID=29523 RepID=UPI003A8E7FD3